MEEHLRVALTGNELIESFNAVVRSGVYFPGLRNEIVSVVSYVIPASDFSRGRKLAHTSGDDQLLGSQHWCSKIPALDHVPTRQTVGTGEERQSTSARNCWRVTERVEVR
jgi:hypothetical protein